MVPDAYNDNGRDGFSHAAVAVSEAQQQLRKGHLCPDSWVSHPRSAVRSAVPETPGDDMANDNDWDADDDTGACLADLTQDGALASIADAIARPLEIERDAYREVAIDKTTELKAYKEAVADVEAEAERRLRRPHLRAVEEA